VFGRNRERSQERAKTNRRELGIDDDDDEDEEEDEDDGDARSRRIRNRNFRGAERLLQVPISSFMDSLSDSLCFSSRDLGEQKRARPVSPFPCLLKSTQLPILRSNRFRG